MSPSKLQLSEVDPKLLKPNPWNPNVMTPQNEEKLANSIERLGVYKPVIVRTLDNGQFEILGGEHRVQIATRRGDATIPVINLGRISDEKAKEIGLADNGRYGADDALRLSELFSSLNSDDLSHFLPYSDIDVEVLLKTPNFDLDSLELTDEDEIIPDKVERAPVQTHRILRFKVPVDDYDSVDDLINRTMRQQGFVSSDSLTNAGDALVFICKNYGKE